MIKKSLPYFLIFIVCLAGYFISKQQIKKTFVEKEIAYRTAKAGEVEMAWGLLDGKLPSQKYWPANTTEKDGILYTRLSLSDTVFTTRLNLPAESSIYYWMVQKKDKSGNPVEVWDSGGGSKEFFTETFSYNSLFKPGYFIFLSGFLPLLFLFFSKENSLKTLSIHNRFKLKEYIPQFDSIRAIAVLLVILHHWLPAKNVLNFLPNGKLGVNIFFVLSGFLITGILLKAKKQVESNSINKSTVFKNFYIRRTLRIFPIYYLVLMVLWFLNDPALKQNSAYFFTYTSNYLFYSEQFFPERLAHLWSLAVEEQFYIFWPWLIVLTPRRFLPYLIGLLLVIGVSSNFIFTSKDWWVEIFTPACFDAFAIGGFLSYLTAYREDVIEQLQPRFKWLAGGVLVLFALDVFHYSFLPSRTVHALLAVVILYYCLFKRNIKAVNLILDNKWLMKLGKISYGVYLYHLFVPELWMWINQNFYKWGIDLFFNNAIAERIKPYWLFVQEFAFLLLLSSLSWMLIEKPINNLKKYFENNSGGKQSSKVEKANSKAYSL